MPFDFGGVSYYDCLGADPATGNPGLCESLVACNNVHPMVPRLPVLSKKLFQSKDA